jgi:hypothetical protein
MATRENNQWPEDLDLLKATLEGLNSHNLAQVWDFALYLLWLQSSLAATEKSRTI